MSGTWVDTTSDVASLLADIKYAWECADNMRGWATRAEEKNRLLHQELYELRQVAKEACLAWTPPGCNEREQGAMTELARLVEVPL